MRLICVPSVLLDRRFDDEQLLAKAEVAEQAHLRNGFTHADIEEFGVSGVSIGCANWSGVVYLSLSPARALRTARARLTSTGPVETGQVRMMRDAVLSTSRLTNS